ncbi:alpha/beta hydrolase-fold protein [Corynebacterium sp. 23_3061]|uniref:alpha/beta hydrolase-fold protein n=1 Tax=Corynebacterium kroppenstedtii TaxID=161879 RepID=UPI00195A85AF|nr:alpha/beta hydrolase-fold protein [Corynebacterium kroppenstedtii]QRQ65070.1 DUF3327 domain-containing protein [Corynebacterium kroppenstedtii]
MVFWWQEPQAPDAQPSLSRGDGRRRHYGTVFFHLSGVHDHHDAALHRMTDHHDGWWSFTVTVPSDLCGSYYIMPAETVPDEIVETPRHHDPHQRIDFRARWKALMKLMVVDPYAQIPPLWSSCSASGTDHFYSAKSSGIVQLDDALPEPGWGAVDVSEASTNNTMAQFTPYTWHSSSEFFQDRHVWVRTPIANRTDNRQRRPWLLILLDGQDWCEAHTGFDSALRALEISGSIPNVTVAAIETTDSAVRGQNRLRDLGCNPAWRSALKDYLIPAITRDYDISDPYVIVAGQSLGGLCAVDCVIESPESFHAAIGCSPSFWFPTRQGPQLPGPLGGLIAEKLQNQATLAALAQNNSRFFFDVGTGEGFMESHARAVVEGLERAHIRHHFDVSTHGHDPAAWRGALTRGLCFIATR